MKSLNYVLFSKICCSSFRAKYIVIDTAFWVGEGIKTDAYDLLIVYIGEMNNYSVQS